MTQSPIIAELRSLRSHPRFLTDSWRDMPDKYTVVARRNIAPGDEFRDRHGRGYVVRRDGSIYRRKIKVKHNFKGVPKSGANSLAREKRRIQFFNPKTV